MIDTVKDSITWLFNQEDARKIIEVIHPREFTVVEAVMTEHSTAKVVAETNKMVQWKEHEAKHKLRWWMHQVSKEFNHSPGDRYIYFRFKRFN